MKIKGLGMKKEDINGAASDKIIADYVRKYCPELLETDDFIVFQFLELSEQYFATVVKAMGTVKGAAVKKYCKDCEANDMGFCDLLGQIVKDDDECRHKAKGKI